VTSTSDRIAALAARKAELGREEGQLARRSSEIAARRPELERRLEAASTTDELKEAEDELADHERELRVIGNRGPRLATELKGTQEGIIRLQQELSTQRVAECMVAADAPLQRILEAIEEIDTVRRAAVEAGAPQHLAPGVHQQLSGARSTTGVATFRLCDSLAERIRGEWRREALPQARAALADR